MIITVFLMFCEYFKDFYYECGSGSFLERQGSVDPDQRQNDMDPQH